jgi:limonene-1,2-epoxide hydrolase
MTPQEVVHAYIAAIEAGATGEVLSRFFAPDVVQVEYPNRLLPAAAHRDLQAILDGAIRGQQVVSNQHFKIVREFVVSETVILEVVWRARLKIALGNHAIGDEISAYIAMFIEVREGVIVEQRNYDCYPA